MLHREISHKRFQIDALDGLRGFAALLVVLSHTSNEGMHLIPFLDFRGTGKSGVYLFFLLSSFLLTLPLLAREGQIFSRPVMGNYWTRRFLRIYPLYTLYLLAALVSTWIMGRFLQMPGLGVPFMLRIDEFFKHLLLIQGKGVTWSIAVEFQFYFVLPLLVFILQKLRNRGLALTTLCFLASVAVCNHMFPPENVVGNDTSLLPYLSIFLFGAFFAVLQEHIQQNGRHAPLILLAVKVLTIPAVLTLFYMTPSVKQWITGRTIHHGYFHSEFILFAACWSLVLMAAIHSRGFIPRLLNFPFLRSCGALSFSLYLFHFPLISALRRLDLPGFVSGWTVMLVTLGASYLSFWLFEHPISKINWKFTKRR